MRKTVSIVFVLALCLSLCACGGREHVEQPAKSAQVQQNKNQPAASKSESAEENTESIGTTYPWEGEFNEKSYVRTDVTAPSGEKITTWKEPGTYGMERRYRCEFPNGDIQDSYYYPSGTVSHFYLWRADGSYLEMHYLDDGYIDPVTKLANSGTTIYDKSIRADGSEREQIWDENGNLTFDAEKRMDGYYSEERHFEDGSSKTVFEDPVTGERAETEYYKTGSVKKFVSSNEQTGVYSEYECYENGNMKKSVYRDAAAESSTEQEYYENGNPKFSKIQTVEQSQEERYGEEGFRTYFRYKSVDFEIECIADESGKLVKVIENGEVKEDEATLTQCAVTYNFLA